MIACKWCKCNLSWVSGWDTRDTMNTCTTLYSPESHTKAADTPLHLIFIYYTNDKLAAHHTTAAIPGVKHIILGTSLWEAGCMLAAWYSKMDGDRARDTFDPSRWLPFLPNHSIQHNIDTFSSMSPDRILRGLGNTVRRYTRWWCYTNFNFCVYLHLFASEEKKACERYLCC